jgi:hypothetical protein
LRLLRRALAWLSPGFSLVYSKCKEMFNRRGLKCYAPENGAVFFTAHGSSHALCPWEFCALYHAKNKEVKNRKPIDQKHIDRQAIK